MHDFGCLTIEEASAHSRYQPGTLAIFLAIVGVAGLLCAVRVKRATWLASRRSD